ncbi:hypothetical protein LJC55_04500, partial [Eubacteriales bacterium OttesenSCG-928-N14]|nr:hypothetical protein [Eubacteriales bacterium OttesenSCG-928-N14]
IGTFASAVIYLLLPGVAAVLAYVFGGIAKLMQLIARQISAISWAQIEVHLPNRAVIPLWFALLILLCPYYLPKGRARVVPVAVVCICLVACFVFL